MRLLLVDDHPVIHDAMRYVFRPDDGAVRCEAVVSMPLACRRLDRSPRVDLVLLDLGLPGYDDIDSLLEMRRRYPATPVAVLSAADDHDIIDRCLSAGAVGFVRKSSPASEMRAALRRIANECYPARSEVEARAAEAEQGSGNAANAAPGDLTSDGAFNEESGRVADLSKAAVQMPLPGIEHLSRRQQDVLHLLVRGMPNKMIARELSLSDNTVKTHVSAVLQALGVINRTQAVLVARRHGWPV